MNQLPLQFYLNSHLKQGTQERVDHALNEIKHVTVLHPENVAASITKSSLCYTHKRGQNYNDLST